MCRRKNGSNTFKSITIPCAVNTCAVYSSIAKDDVIKILKFVIQQVDVSFSRSIYFHAQRLSRFSGISDIFAKFYYLGYAKSRIRKSFSCKILIKQPFPKAYSDFPIAFFKAKRYFIHQKSFFFCWNDNYQLCFLQGVIRYFSSVLYLYILIKSQGVNQKHAGFLLFFSSFLAIECCESVWEEERNAFKFMENL